MRIAGGLIRRGAAYSAIAAGATLLLVFAATSAAARTGDPLAAAETTAAAALYEPVPADRTKASTAVKSASSTGSASTSTASPATADSSPETADSLAPEADTVVPHASAPPVTTETVVVPTSMPAPSYVREGGSVPPSTTEIPQSMGAPEPATADIDRAADAQAIYYQARQNPQLIDPQLHSLQEFVSEGDESSPLGVQLREDQRKLNSGEIANGLLIVAVRKGSAAAMSGLHEARHTARNVVAGMAVAASLFFPPAVLMVPILDQVNLGDSYDMIIGVDGKRVANYLDFEDRMRDVQPGEIVYLSIVRNGDRVQVPLHVQALSDASF